MTENQYKCINNLLWAILMAVVVIAGDPTSKLLFVVLSVLYIAFLGLSLYYDHKVIKEFDDD